MKKISLLTLGMATAISCQSVAADNLMEIFNQALDHDPVLQASAANVMSVAEGITQNRAPLLPQLNGRITRQLSDFAVEGEISPGVPSDPFDSKGRTRTWTIQLQQELFDWRTWKALSQAELRATQAEVNHGAELQNLIIKVAQRYFDVLFAEDSLEFAGAEKDAFQKELEQSRQRYDVGLIAVTDVYNAQANYDQAVAREITAKNSLDNAYEALREVTGTYHYDLLELQDELPLARPQPENLDDWVRVAQEQNLALRARMLDVDIAREEIKRRRAGHYPTANLFANYTDQEQFTQRMFDNPLSPSGTTNNLNEGASLTFQVDVPIFSGLRTSSEVDQAQYDFQRASYQLEEIYRATQRNTRSAYLGIDSSIGSVKAFRQSEASSASALEATEAGYEVGTRTIVDVLNSTRALYQAKQNLARARYDYVLNTLRLKQAAGILTDEDLLIVNTWLR